MIKIPTLDKEQQINILNNDCLVSQFRYTETRDLEVIKIKLKNHIFRNNFVTKVNAKFEISLLNLFVVLSTMRDWLISSSNKLFLCLKIAFRNVTS